MNELDRIARELASARETAQRLGAELSSITRAAGNAELSEGQLRRWNDTSTALDKANADVTRLTNAYDLERTEHIGRLERVESAWKAGDAESIDPEPSAFNVNRFRDPWADGPMSFGPTPQDDLRCRAEAAVEQAECHVDIVDVDATRNRCITALEERAVEDPVLAAWAVATSRPAYERAFFKIVRHPQTFAAMLDDAERAVFAATQQPIFRAMNEGSISAGQAMVPFFLDPAILLTNVGSMSPMRQLATVKTIGTQTWHGVTSVGVTAEWAAEAAEAADASPTVGQPAITPIRGDAYLQASFEMLQDTDLANDIAMLITDARDNIEATGFVTGTGSTQPKGVVTAVGAVTASRVAGSSGAGGSADFVLADIYAVDNAVPYRWRKRGLSWLAEITIANKIRRFGEGTVANTAFWTELGGGTPPSLLGHPFYIASAMDNTIVSGSSDDVLLLGDFSQYYVVDRVGTSIAFNPLVVDSNRRPTGEVGWFAFWRTGGDVASTADAFRIMRL